MKNHLKAIIPIFTPHLCYIDYPLSLYHSMPLRENLQMFLFQLLVPFLHAMTIFLITFIEFPLLNFFKDFYPSFSLVHISFPPFLKFHDHLHELL
jgi:hypothetical protein